MPITEAQEKYIKGLAEQVLYTVEYFKEQKVSLIEVLSVLLVGKKYSDIDPIDAGVLISVLNAAKSAQYHAGLTEASRSSASVPSRDSGVLPSEASRG